MMRKIAPIYILPFLCAVVISGCNDDDEGLKTQDHDQNEMMSIMHDMSDEINISLKQKSNESRKYAELY